MAAPQKSTTDTAFLFLGASLLLGLGWLLFGSCCSVLQFFLALIFLLATANDPFGFKYAKNHLLLVIVFNVLEIITILVGYLVAFGSSGLALLDVRLILVSLAAMPISILAMLAFMMLFYGIFMLGLVLLAYKAHKGDECPGI